MAFDFPPAKDGLRVTNPESGVTYVYRDKYQSWIIEGVDNKQVKIHRACNVPCYADPGDLWFDPCTNCLWVFHDNEWMPVADCANEGGGQFKGEVERAWRLPDADNEVGDMWIVLKEKALYTWSSEGWIPADRYDDEELRGLIKEEKAERIAADVGLTQIITANNIKSEAEDQKLWDAIGEETADRIAGDEALWDKIEECCTNATEGLEGIEDRLDQEIKDREDGDKASQQQIDALDQEIAHTNEQLDTEINDRIAADDELRDAISDEAAQREAEDKILRSLIAAAEPKWMGEVPTATDLPDTRYIWRPSTEIGNETIYSISWGNDCFIAGSSNGGLWQSDDGCYWQRRNPGVSFHGRFTATLVTPGLFLAGGENGMLSSSADGQNWTALNSTTNSSIQALAFDGNAYVYVTDGGVIGTSTDGVSWTKQDHTITWGEHGLDSITDVHYCEQLSRFVAVTARGMVLLSDTGLSWNLVDPGLKGGKLLTVCSYTYTDSGDEKFLLVAGGDFPERLLYSEDSLNWHAAPANPFGAAVVTDLEDCGHYLAAALSDGHTAYAVDANWSWTVEATGASERILATCYAPKNQHVPYAAGIHIQGGTDGQLMARLPGDGLEPGDTWGVLDEMALYTWSSHGWITGGSGGGGLPGVSGGISRLLAGTGIVLNPTNGVGAAVEIAVDTDLAFDDSDLQEAIADNTAAIGENATAIGENATAIGKNTEAIEANETAIGEEAEARESADQALNQLIVSETEDREQGLEENWKGVNALVEKEAKEREEADAALAELIENAGTTFYGAQPPADVEFQEGSLFICDSSLKIYVFDGATWVELSGTGRVAEETNAGTAAAPLTYRLETDKTVSKAFAPQIQLVDSNDMLTNVTFLGEDGLQCRSTGAGIVISAADLQAQINELKQQIAELTKS